MGRPGAKTTSVIAVDVDSNGQVRYDAIVKQGINKNKIVKSTIEDMKESEVDEQNLTLPVNDEEQETADRTKKALEALLEGKIIKAKPSSILNATTDIVEPTYIRYTPNPNAPGYIVTYNI
jgi:SNW domain-containing protein 1